MNGHFKNGAWIETRCTICDRLKVTDVNGIEGIFDFGKFYNELSSDLNYIRSVIDAPISLNTLIETSSGKTITMKLLLHRLEQLESKVFSEYLKEQL